MGSGIDHQRKTLTSAFPWGHAGAALVLVSLNAAGQDRVPPPRGDDTMAAVTASLAASTRAYLELPRTYWDPGEDVTARAVISPVSGADLAAGRLVGNWRRMAAALANRPPGARGYAAVVAVYDEAGKEVVWEGELPLDPGPLAKAAEALVRDRTVFSRLDPPAVVPVRIPGGSLKPGKGYRFTLSFRDPNGRGHRFPDGSTPDSAPTIIVRAMRLDLRKLQLPARVADAAELLASAVEVENPGRRRFPKDDPDDCQARSVWCLRAFRGRVYVGFGDWAKNRGPIPLWSFGPDDPALARRYGRYSFATDGVPRLRFAHEYTVQEHAIERLRVWGGRLIVPGLDGCREDGPDGIVFASVYIREKEHWRKLSTLPRAFHVTDALGSGDRLYAAVDRLGDFGPSLVVSDDIGLSWTRLADCEGELVAFGGGLLILSGTVAEVREGGASAAHRGEFTPGSEPDRVHRATPFAGGVIYTTWDSWGRSKAAHHPLFFLRDPKEGPRLVGPFHDRNVRDLVVDGEILHVLTGKATGAGQFEGEVYSSRDLEDWTRLAAFRVPAMPNALAPLGGAFYVGLANRGFDANQYDDLKPTAYLHADRAAGSIYRLAK